MSTDEQARDLPPRVGMPAGASETIVYLICPDTKQAVSTGVDLGASTRAMSLVSTPFQCPACAQTHLWEKAAGEIMATVR